MYHPLKEDQQGAKAALILLAANPICLETQQKAVCPKTVNSCFLQREAHSKAMHPDEKDRHLPES